MRCVPAKLSVEISILSGADSDLGAKTYSWKTMPEEIIGDIPSSIRVPRLLANIIRNQYRGSEVSDDTMP